MIEFTYILFMITCILIFIYDKCKVKRSWHDPLYFFLIMMILYISPLSLRFFLKLPAEGNITKHFDDLRYIYPYALLITTISIIFFYVAYRLSPVLRITKYIVNKGALIERRKIKLFRVGVFLALISSLAFIIFSQNYGGIKELLLKGYIVTEIFSQEPKLAISLSVFSVSSLVILYSYSQTKNKKELIISLILFSSFMLIQIVLSRRAQIVIWGLSYLISYSLLVKKISFSKIAPLIIIGFLFLNILGHVRQGNYEDISYFITRFDDKISALDEDKSSAFYTLTTGQFAIPYETLPMLMEKLETSDLRYGSTLLDVFYQWVPRSIWKDKSYGNAHWYYKEFYDYNAKPNEGRNFFFLSEGYLNFGILGVLIWAILWGIFWKNISYLIKPINNKILIISTFIYSTYVASMISLLINDSVGLFVAHIKSTLFWFVPVYFIAALFTLKLKK